MGSHQKKKKRTKDTRAVTSEIKRQQDLDANRLAIQPTFEGSTYAPRGVGLIEFVNVSTAIAAAQTGAGGAGQVTGLNAVPNSQTQITLTWTAVSGATSYNVYQSLISGSTGSLVASPTSTTSIRTGLSPGTTYYYQVAAVNALGEGLLSVQDSATTDSAPGLPTSLWLKLDNNFNDSSGLGSVVVNNFSLFLTPGKFGSHYLSIDESGAVASDTIKYIRLSSNTNIRMDLTTVGFSVSFWFRGFAPGGLGYDGVVIHKCDSTTAPITGYCVEVKGNGKAVFVVQRDVSTIYRFENGGLFLDGTAWHHIACTFNAATNAGVVYVNGVAGTSSSEGVWGAFGSTTSMYIGKHPTHVTLGDGTSYIWGDLDEIQYFKGVVLTQAQVTSLKNNNSTS